jgi:hypothetical protein
MYLSVHSGLSLRPREKANGISPRHVSIPALLERVAGSELHDADTALNSREV